MKTFVRFEDSRRRDARRGLDRRSSRDFASRWEEKNSDQFMIDGSTVRVYSREFSYARRVEREEFVSEGTRPLVRGCERRARWRARSNVVALRCVGWNKNVWSRARDRDGARRRGTVIRRIDRISIRRFRRRATVASRARANDFFGDALGSIERWCNAGDVRERVWKSPRHLRAIRTGTLHWKDAVWLLTL